MAVPVAHGAAALMAFIELRRVLCYRDKQGRKVFGVLDLDDVKDTPYGFVTGLTITAVDWVEGV